MVQRKVVVFVAGGLESQASSPGRARGVLVRSRRRRVKCPRRPPFERKGGLAGCAGDASTKGCGCERAGEGGGGHLARVEGGDVHGRCRLYHLLRRVLQRLWGPTRTPPQPTLYGAMEWTPPCLRLRLRLYLRQHTGAMEQALSRSVGLDTDTAELTGKTLLSHRVTKEIDYPANNVRSHMSVSSPTGVHVGVSMRCAARRDPRGEEMVTGGERVGAARGSGHPGWCSDAFPMMMIMGVAGDPSG
eukprot:566355-Prorocentrum_minimum.AAC.3